VTPDAWENRAVVRGNQWSCFSWFYGEFRAACHVCIVVSGEWLCPFSPVIVSPLCFFSLCFSHLLKQFHFCFVLSLALNCLGSCKFFLSFSLFPAFRSEEFSLSQCLRFNSLWKNSFFLSFFLLSHSIRQLSFTLIFCLLLRHSLHFVYAFLFFIIFLSQTMFIRLFGFSYYSVFAYSA
jgi:hypothetical protein